MGRCRLCDGDDGLSYTCNECGETFCSEHRLPENHRCSALRDDGQGDWPLATGLARDDAEDGRGLLARLWARLFP